MGVYVCEAFNGVPPNDTQEFNVHVYCELYIISQKTNIHLGTLCSFSDDFGGRDCCRWIQGKDNIYIYRETLNITLLFP